MFATVIPQQVPFELQEMVFPDGQAVDLHAAFWIACSMRFIMVHIPSIPGRHSVL